MPACTVHITVRQFSQKPRRCRPAVPMETLIDTHRLIKHQQRGTLCLKLASNRLSPRTVSQAQILIVHQHRLRVVYFPSSAHNRVMARCKSLASVSENSNSKLSCICFTIPRKRAVDERSWSAGSLGVRVEKCSPFRQGRLETSVASG